MKQNRRGRMAEGHKKVILPFAGTAWLRSCRSLFHQFFHRDKAHFWQHPLKSGAFIVVPLYPSSTKNIGLGKRCSLAYQSRMSFWAVGFTAFSKIFEIALDKNVYSDHNEVYNWIVYSINIFESISRYITNCVENPWAFFYICFFLSHTEAERWRK